MSIEVHDMNMYENVYICRNIILVGMLNILLY